MNLINLCFADDLLMFVRGDQKSVELLMNRFEFFSESTGLEANKLKCFIYSAGLNEEDERVIRGSSGCSKGNLPFKYLGVPLDMKKLSIKNCLPLIDRITSKIRHWTTKYLSYAGRLQLLKSVIFGIASYWLNIFPLPKAILKHVEKISRTFLWCGKDSNSRKAPVAWRKLCLPKNAGGLNIIDLTTWRTTICLKNMWNLSGKAEKLWVKWIHTYYFKKSSLMEFRVTKSCSWILKSTLKCRDIANTLDMWNKLKNEGKFPTRIIYSDLQGDETDVSWRKLFYNNIARPRSKFIAWLLCHDALPTKERLKKCGIVTDLECSFYTNEETHSHLFFECIKSREIWSQVLRWIKSDHRPEEWNKEIEWILKASKGSSPKCRIIKSVAVETIYHLWKARNEKIFQQREPSKTMWSDICKVISYRGGKNPRLHRYISSLES